jgi:glycerol-1-phosphate dehydrogenase [NAD(P)+]
VAAAELVAPLLASDRPCACGRRHVVPTREVLIESRALERLPELAVRLGLTGPCAVVADEITAELAGQHAADLLEDAALVILRPETSDGSLEASEEAVGRLLRSPLVGQRFLVAVGSGTINDIVKLAATRASLPYLAVATAPSMNGYPSAIAAILVGGIKRTLPADPPVGIVCDTDILCAAPAEMVSAGYGDLLSKSVSSADWRMAHLVTGEYYCDVPVQVVDEAERLCRERAAEIKRREPEAVALQSGISMAMAGSSAPASGGEHLLSHYWDMTAPARGRRHDLHGRQTAVGSLVSAALYEALRERLPQVDLESALAARPDAGRAAGEAWAHFAPLLGPDAAAAISEELRAKHAPAERVRERLAPIAADPDILWNELGSVLRSRAELAESLTAGGAPTTVAGIGVPPDEARAAFRHARDIRSRYTVLDLAADLGLLHDLANEVLERSRVLA